MTRKPPPPHDTENTGRRRGYVPETKLRERKVVAVSAAAGALVIVVADVVLRVVS